MTFYQNYLNGYAPLNKMAIRAKNRKTFKQHLLPGQWSDFKMILQKLSSLAPKNRKTFKRHLLPGQMAQFQINFTEMFLLCPFTKIAKMVPLRKTKWPPELKIEKHFKRHLLLGQGPDFKIISLKCFSNAPLPKLIKWFGSADQNGRQS